MEEKNVLTVKEVLQRAREDGLYISEAFLRQLVLSNAIPSRKIGSWIYISYSDYVSFITGGDVTC